MNDKNGDSFGFREFLGAVNLRDFGQMVGSEISQIGAIVHRSFESFGSLPFGPIAFFWGMFMAMFRSCLLTLVVFTFGAGILAITAARVVLRVLHIGRGAPPVEEPEETGGEEE